MNRKDETKTILIVDGYHLLHKGFYGSLKRKNVAVNREGTPINAIYTFIAKINNFVELDTYHTIIVTFDVGSSCWRRDLYPEYKAKRKETPPELIPQMQIIREFLTSANIPWYEKESFEGDDVIGTISSIATKLGYKVHILSNDKDLFQLVDDNALVIVEASKKEKAQYITSEEVVERLGCLPHQVPDLKSLMGDASDNIKGVKSLHYNTVLRLLKKYDNIETIYENIDEIQGNVAQKLIDHRAQIELNKNIATINKNVDLGRINFRKLTVNWYGYLNFLKKQKMWAFTAKPIKHIHEIEAKRNERLAKEKSIDSAVQTHKVKRKTNHVRLSSDIVKEDQKPKKALHSKATYKNNNGLPKKDGVIKDKANGQKRVDLTNDKPTNNKPKTSYYKQKNLRRTKKTNNEA